VRAGLCVCGQDDSDRAREARAIGHDGLHGIAMRRVVLSHGLLACRCPLLNDQVPVAICSQGGAVLSLGLCVAPPSAVEAVAITAAKREDSLEKIQLVHSEHGRCAVHLDGVVHYAHRIEHNVRLEKVPNNGVIVAPSATADLAVCHREGTKGSCLCK
jgi:hypothetical protein